MESFLSKPLSYYLWNVCHTTTGLLFNGKNMKRFVKRFGTFVLKKKTYLVYLTLTNLTQKTKTHMIRMIYQHYHSLE